MFQIFIPYVTIKKQGYYEDAEAEILFTTHTIFQIDRIDKFKILSVIDFGKSTSLLSLMTIMIE